MDELKNKIKEIIMDWVDEWSVYKTLNDNRINGLDINDDLISGLIADEIISLFHGSKTYPNEYKISTSKETVNLEEYIKASQNDGL